MKIWLVYPNMVHKAAPELRYFLEPKETPNLIPNITPLQSRSSKNRIDILIRPPQKTTPNLSKISNRRASRLSSKYNCIQIWHQSIFKQQAQNRSKKVTFFLGDTGNWEEEFKKESLK